MLRRVNVPGERSKLKKKFRGPYMVKKVLDKNRYIVGDLDNFQVTRTRFEGVFDPLNMRLYQKAKGKENEGNVLNAEQHQGVEYLEDDKERSLMNEEEYQDVEYLEEEDTDVEYEDVEYLEDEYE